MSKGKKQATADNYNPLKLEWSAVADTKEQFILFANFIKAFKDLKEKPIKSKNLIHDKRGNG